ncbi:hypothetical protein ABLW17_04705 [Anaerococcus murdochii]|uniref:Uncharacterized protein n=1 Tax=Anaerococcus murdochii TaxID=411577 RepID=A0ABS7SYA2_9FIRM|nr:hypothetical protein [Anaerococcus murdochii]MBZ2386500.1 hypothetical protein [Anaerococcus murdochii]
MERFKKIIIIIYYICLFIVASNALATRDNLLIRLLAAIVLVVSLSKIFKKETWTSLFAIDANKIS